MIKTFRKKKASKLYRTARPSPPPPRSSTIPSDNSIVSCVIRNDITEERMTELQVQHTTNLPYPHLVLNNLYNDKKMRLLAEEAKNNMTATFKETGKCNAILRDNYSDN